MAHPFDVEPCSRCGGSGSYSYCQMYGTRCFKCAGKGKYLSKHGQKDYDRWRAAVDAATVRPIGDLAVGMAVRISDMTKYHRVAAISAPHRGRVGHQVPSTGETIWPDVITVSFAQPVTVSGAMGNYQQSDFDVPAADGTVRIHPGDELMPKAQDFVTPRRRRCPECRRMYTATPAVTSRCRRDVCPSCLDNVNAEEALMEQCQGDCGHLGAPGFTVQVGDLRVCRPCYAAAEQRRLDAEAQAIREEQRVAAQQEQYERSHYFGTVDARDTFVLTFKRIIPLGASSRFEQPRWLYCFEDSDGNAAVWFTGSGLGVEVGTVVTVDATVKEHREYRGQQQTVLSRVKVQAAKEAA